MQKGYFSLAIDEYTDISNLKWLAIVFKIRVNGKIGSIFYDLIKLVESDHLTLFNAIETIFT